VIVYGSSLAPLVRKTPAFLAAPIRDRKVAA
jgi:hypothetical protein